MNLSKKSTQKSTPHITCVLGVYREAVGEAKNARNWVEEVEGHGQKWAIFTVGVPRLSTLVPEAFLEFFSFLLIFLRMKEL